MKIQNEICDICTHLNDYDRELFVKLESKFGKNFVPYGLEQNKTRDEFWKSKEVPCVTVHGIMAICKKHLGEMMEAFK